MFLSRNFLIRETQPTTQNEDMKLFQEKYLGL